MKLRYLVLVPASALLIACGGSATPEPATPAEGSAQEEKAETPAQEAAEAKAGGESEEKGETPAAEAAEHGGEKGTEAAPAAEKAPEGAKK